MIKRKIIESGLVLILGIPNLGLPEKIQETKQVTTTQTIQEEKTNYQLTEEWFKGFLGSYINREAETTWFKDSIKKFGREKFQEEYEKAHLESLIFAEEKVKKFREGKIKNLNITEEECTQLGEKMCKRINSVSAGWVDYNAPEVQKTQRDFVKTLAGHFTKIAQVEEKCKNYKEIVRKAYQTKQNYEMYISAQNKANNTSLEELRRTISRIYRILGGDKEMDKIKEDANQTYNQTIQQIFPESKKD